MQPDSGDSGRTRVVTTRHDASRSPTTTTEGPRRPTTKTTDKDLNISRKIHAPALYSSLSYRVFGVYNWTLCPISSHSACSSSSQLAAFSLSSNILGVLVIDLMRHSHVYFSRRARVLHHWRRSRYYSIFSACSLFDV